MRYAVFRFKQEQEEAAYRIYVTDTLRLLSENTAKSSGGARVTKRWWDIVHRPAPDTRTGAQIARDIIEGAGLEVRKKSEPT